MDNLLWLFFGFLLASLGQWLFKFWRRVEHCEKQADAEQVLKKYGMSSQLYLATVGTEDPELRSALDALAFTGHIITDAKGNIVGKLCPGTERRVELRLVVSNDRDDKNDGS